MAIVYPMKDYSGTRIYNLRPSAMTAGFLDLQVEKQAANPSDVYTVGNSFLGKMFFAGGNTAPFAGAFNYQTNWDTGSMYNYMYYNKITPNNTPIIILVTAVKISTLSLTGYVYPTTYLMNPSNVVPDIYTASPEMSAADFKTAYADKYVITSIKIYNNTNDGGIGGNSQRALMGTVGSTGYYDIYMRYYATKYYTYPGDYDILFPIFSTMFLTSATSGYAKWEHFFNKRMNYTTFISTSTAVGSGYATQGNGKFKVFDNLDQIKAWLNYLNFPWTFTESEATSSNSADFPDYIPNGQPTDATGGGTGTGDNSSDDITTEDPDLSPLSVFNKHYACTQGNLNTLSNYLWTSTFIDDIKLLFNDPMECVVNCKMFPFSIAAHDSSHVGALENIKLGNVETTAQAHPISSTYSARFDLGSIPIEEYFGNAMDYEPYTKLSIFLPYIGIKDISTNDFMGKTLAVKYVVDITTGGCIAQIWAGEQLLYTYDGKIAVEIPINSSNAAQFAAGLAMTGITAAAGIGVGAATGSGLAIAGTMLATAKSVAGNQFHVSKGGANTPYAAFYLPQYAYLIINRPIQSLASNFGDIYGFPCNVTKVLSSLSGFTQIDDVHLSGINATTAELDEIYLLLKEGVIL